MPTVNVTVPVIVPAVVEVTAAVSDVVPLSATGFGWVMVVVVAAVEAPVTVSCADPLDPA